MFNTGVFNYVNVMQKTMDATAMRSEVILNNMANVNTPGYKRKDIRFETELKHAFARASQDTVDARVKNLDLEALTPKTYTDYEELSYRYDGNNVDINNENAILAEVQTKYNALMDLINSDFASMRAAMQ
ncbi:MAG: flagellar basal body rod protein FlgB [Lachnospiraceae bacterium]|nr:flagellar basal body rod protein FlgB [Lachnospiraceae bacterium]MCI9399091.1 flagellar basal body rod protein FlgB [Lachnospiraceae bacterium]MCX4376377.1 flagellar basal body rod protein FlgB [Lachnospiraceae bacterium]